MPIQRDDEQDLKWLIVGHYAAAAMTLLAGLFFAGFFLLMGRFIQAAEQSSSRSDRLAAEFGQRFTEIIGASTAVYFLLIAGALISVGVLVSRRRSYRLCLGLSALNATSLAYWCPFGPIAAAFTCRLLRRPSIQVQFADNGFPTGADSRTVWDLQAISLGCYVLAGYMGLSSLVGVATMTWVMNLVPEAPNAAFAKTLMIGIALVVSAANTAAFGVLGFLLAGTKLRGLCVALAILLLIFFPLGTAVGVLLLIVLSRPDIRAAFGHGQPKPPAAVREPI